MSEASFVLSVNYEKVFTRIKDSINMKNWFKKKEIFYSLKNNEINKNSSPRPPPFQKRQIKKSQLLSKQNILKILARDIPIILAHGYFEMSTKYKFIRIKSGKIITYENFWKSVKYKKSLIEIHFYHILALSHTQPLVYGKGLT